MTLSSSTNPWLLFRFIKIKITEKMMTISKNYSQVTNYIITITVTASDSVYRIYSFTYPFCVCCIFFHRSTPLLGDRKKQIDVFIFHVSYCHTGYSKCKRFLDTYHDSYRPCLVSLRNFRELKGEKTIKISEKK